MRPNLNVCVLVRVFRGRDATIAPAAMSAPNAFDFTVAVKIDGRPVPVFRRGGDTFVECNLMHPTTYEVPEQEGDYSGETAMWPVTPYTLTLSNNDQDTDIHATVYVDGCKVASRVVKKGRSKDIIGIDDGTSTRELLFSFPRLTSSHNNGIPADRLPHIGEIRAVIRRATFRRYGSGPSRGDSFDR